VRADLPVGRVTLLLTDIEGSTRLIEVLGETRYIEALEEHRRVLRNAFSAHGGVEVDTQGDAFLYGFADPGEALAAAAEGQAALDGGPVRVRMGLHTGELQLTGEGYAGRELHRAARIASSGHGGQVVVSAATRALAHGELIELGEHRLKDFDDPVALFQLGSERFPPLNTISNTNLPRPASSFIGRTHERNELLDLIRNGARLVTLSGPGGSGKTRLAIDLASELVPTFKAGVFWVPLATLRDPELVVQTVAQTLGSSNGLVDHIGERELLLLLDNFEQVVDAAPELAELLESCPNLKLLVTSRELLRIRGEVDYPVPPLAEPEAVELFCARSHLDADKTIAELCRRLDDLPLAVELAAARSHVLTPAQTLDRLGRRLDLLKGGRDADPRQQTLRTTIEWSYDLLDAEEQELFARLAVFAGGCTLAAAEDVCRADLDQLQSLVDKSLLRHTGDRFWMLETIREFGAERLESLPESDSISEQHARWYLDLAQGDKDDEAGVRAAERLARLDDELENLRRAIAWAASHDAPLEVDLVTATRYFLGMRGHLREGLGYLRHALETARSSSLDEAGLLLGAAQLAYDLGENTAAQQCSEQLLELGHTREDPRLTAIALFLLSQALRAQGETERAHALLLDAVEPARTADDGIVLMSLAHCLGEIAFEADDFETAQSHFQDELDRARDLPNPRSESIALASLGMVSLTLGDTDAAAAYLEDALRITIALQETVGVLETLVTLAEVVVHQGRLSRAARLLGASDALRAETAYSLDRMLQDQHARVMAAIGDDPALNAARSEGLAMTMDEAAAYALAD
jgi:predicted ATPase